MLDRQRPSPDRSGMHKIEDYLQALSIDEKISLLSGKDFWTLPAIERLGIRSLRLSDGPTGLRSSNSDPATVFPVGVALAATWNRDLVCDVAVAIGQEAQQHNVDVLLAPGVNIQRTPLGGRNFEYFSEDPYLTGEIGIAYVSGVQSQGIGTSVKHYTANNQEHERMTGSSNMSERVLREVYLAAFEAIVKAANPWTVMSAYNRINGIYASEHDELLNKILKDEWGYDGVVVSDWGAAKSTEGSANCGLDLEMPGPARFYGAALKQAIEAGTVSETTLDDHVRRVLRLIDRCGGFDATPPQGERSWHPSEAHRTLAKAAAVEGAVLLKNERSLLPLSKGQTIAVIGAFADYPAIQGGGSSQVTPDRVVTPLEGLREAFGPETEIAFERGIDPEPRAPVIDGQLLSPDPDRTQQGLSVTYYSKPDYSGDAVAEGIDWRFSKLGFGEAAQAEGDLGFSVEWTGYITPRYTGEHSLVLTHSNQDVELYIDGQELVGPHTDRETEMLFMILPLNKRKARIHLEAGQSYPITIRYSQTGDKAIRAFNIFNVSCREPEPDRAAAIRLAKRADKAILFVGSGTTSETEGKDRASMALTEAQNSLVEDVLEANPDTVVVVNTGGPVEMPWAPEAPAILQAWLPGQEGGHALGALLSGAESPSGKLPVTFPKRYEDNPTAAYYPGSNEVEYGEGLFVGYKNYDAFDVEPLFPFGHGLSYSSFALKEMKVHSNWGDDGTVQVDITLHNNGRRTAAETVQVYVEPLERDEQTPVRQLRTFQKVSLAASEDVRLTFHLSRRDFSIYCVDQPGWRAVPGAYKIHVGTSSRDLSQSQTIVIPE